MKRSSTAFVRTASLLTVFCSCGIFIPRDVPESPISSGSDLDPFNFRGILVASNVQFATTDYRYILDPNFRFVEDFGFHREFDREDVIGRLDQIVDTCDSISVKWARNTSVQEPFFTKDTVELLRRYRVYFSRHRTDAPEGGTSIDSGDGNAALTLVKAPGGWTLYRWIDGPAISFFHPLSTDP